MKLIVLILFSFFCSLSKAQKPCLIKFFQDTTEKYSVKVKDSNERKIHVTKYVLKLTNQGYFNVKFDIKKVSDTVQHVLFEKGKKYKWVNIEKNNSLEQIVKWKNDPTPDNINSYINKTLDYFENNGYPFAEVLVEKIKLRDDSLLTGRWTFKKNNFYVIDSVVIKGKTKTAPHIIQKVTGITPGIVYNESLVKSVQKNISMVNYLEYIRAPEVSFTPEGKCMITLFVKDKSDNQFDGILGINPDEASGKIIVTGDLNLGLRNIFKGAETIKIQWYKSKASTQNFHLFSEIPYIFKTKLELSGELLSYREDTSFSRLTTKIGLGYLGTPSQRIKFYISAVSSTRLSEQNLTSFPDYNSSNVFSYGISFWQRKLDNIINPQKGLEVSFSVETGKKRLVLNESIFDNEYTSLAEKTTQYQLYGKLDWYIPFFKRSTILLTAKGAGIFNDQIFENELYQIGGINSIRGFNEQAISASSYTVFTVEYRFLLDRLSSLFAFFDFAYVERKTNSYSSDKPIGAGLGFNLGSKSGVFSFAYALGTQEGNPILLKNGKVHFGFTSHF